MTPEEKRARIEQIDDAIAALFAKIQNARLTLDVDSIEFTVQNAGTMESMWTLKCEQAFLLGSAAAMEDYSKQAESWASRKTQAVSKRKEDLLPKLMAILEKRQQARERMLRL